jgi:hypothetical protein
LPYAWVLDHSEIVEVRQSFLDELIVLEEKRVKLQLDTQPKEFLLLFIHVMVAASIYGSS